MLVGTTLIASLVVVSLSVPAIAQSAVPWEGGQPVFEPRANTLRGDTARQGGQYREAYHERRRYYEPRWRSYDRRRAYNRRDYDRRWDGYGRRGYDPWWWGGERRRAPEPSGPAQLSGGERPNIAPNTPEKVAFPNNESEGTIIIDSEARKLYYTLSETEAYQYPVSVGREGFDWYGTENVTRVAAWPDWHPPESMRQRQPELPKMMTGGIRNPLGAKAIYLGDTLYRIHGTNETSTIGQAASSGCFRMMNEDVVHLASLVDVGTTVKVVRRWQGSEMAQAEEPRDDSVAASQ